MQYTTKFINTVKEQLPNEKLIHNALDINASNVGTLLFECQKKIIELHKQWMNEVSEFFKKDN